MTLLTNTFSIEEAAFFVSLEPALIRNEIGAVLPFPPLPFEALLYLRALEWPLPPTDVRVELFRQIGSLCKLNLQAPRDITVRGLRLPLARLSVELVESIRSFEKWCATRVAFDPTVVPGMHVFRGTRIPIRRVVEGGDAVRAMYPLLSQRDVAFARLFVRTHPDRSLPPLPR